MKETNHHNETSTMQEFSEERQCREEVTQVLEQEETIERVNVTNSVQLDTIGVLIDYERFSANGQFVFIWSEDPWSLTLGCGCILSMNDMLEKETLAEMWKRSGEDQAPFNIVRLTKTKLIIAHNDGIIVEDFSLIVVDNPEIMTDGDAVGAI